MRKILVLGVLFAVSFLPALSACADELRLKNGSIIRGKVTQVVPGKSFKILTKDGSEIVYQAETVETVEMGGQKEADSGDRENRSDKLSDANVKPPTKVRADADAKPSKTMLPVTPVISIGRYGTLGLGVDVRPANRFGFGFGGGGTYYSLSAGDYDGRYGDSEDASGFAPIAVMRETIYFTGRERKAQHGLVFGQYYSALYGPMLSFSYSWEYHWTRGIGLGLGLGVVVPLGDYEEKMDEYLSDKEDIHVRDGAVTFVPLLFDITLLF